MCDVREIGTILRSLSIFPDDEKQLLKWISEIEEEEPSDFIAYEKFESLVIFYRCDFCFCTPVSRICDSRLFACL